MTDRCTQYAIDVLAGRINAGNLVKKACQRHMDDLEASKTAPFVYWFDVAASNEIIDFAEELEIAEGEEREKIHLYPFQCFILGSLNGWKKKEGNYRRFRTSYVQLGRQNGKSFLNGILACYYGNFTAYQYPKIFCTATKQDQADIVFDEVKKFIRSDKDLDECFKIHDHNHTIECLITNGVIRSISGDTKSLDGHRPYLAIVDEYHAHPTNQMYKLCEGGIKKMKQALISVITTAGFNLNAPCFKLYEHCKRILQGATRVDSQFIYIAELDEGDDIWLPENWIKANPTLAYDQEALENLVPIATTARDMGGEDLRDFMVKQLNKWIQWSNHTYLRDMEMWKRCASDRDLTTIVFVSPFYVDGKNKYFIHSHSFMPAKRVQEHIDTDLAPYDVWVDHKLITVTETMGGIKTDYRYILAYMQAMVDAFGLVPRLICYDPHNASAFLQDLEATGYDSLEIHQTAKALSDPTEDLRLEIEAGNVEYNRGEELLTWSIANARTICNNYGEIKIDKDQATQRIDPIDALIDAWKVAMCGDTVQTTEEIVDEWLKMYAKHSTKKVSINE